MVIDAAGKAGEMFDDARDSVGTNAKRVTKAVGFGASLTGALDSAVKSFQKAADWAKDDPMRAATTGVSMAIGAGLGVVFTGISSHWLLNSAMPTWSVKKLAQEFDGYLSRREELIENGHLTEADAEQITFERDIAKRIGAPLLGAFSFASGAVMMTNILNPKTITGLPARSRSSAATRCSRASGSLATVWSALRRAMIFYDRPRRTGRCRKAGQRSKRPAAASA